MEGTTTNTARSERVRFVAPAVLSFDGFDEEFPVEIINLSAQGAGILGPDGLEVGNQILLRFRLTLCDEPVMYRCRVLWRQTVSRKQAKYGLSFVQLPPTSQKALMQTVQERSEGKALAWSGWGQEGLMEELSSSRLGKSKGVGSSQGSALARAGGGEAQVNPQQVSAHPHANPSRSHAPFVIQGAPPLPAPSASRPQLVSNKLKRGLGVGLLAGLIVGIWLPQPHLPALLLPMGQWLMQQMHHVWPQ